MHKWLLPALVVGVALGAIGCKSSPQASAPSTPHTAPASQPAAAESGAKAAAPEKE